MSVNDSALAINHFYGGGAGLRLGITPGRFFATVTGKVAVGATSQSLRLDGTTTLTGAGDTQTVPGGLLVPASNSARFNQSQFTWMPEVGVKVGFQITPSIGVYAGYNFLYMTNVVRPGENFSSRVNPTQLPSSQNFGVPFGPANPGVSLQSSDFWMHTVGVGVNFKFSPANATTTRSRSRGNPRLLVLNSATRKVFSPSPHSLTSAPRDPA